jgi:hypothetical protein
MTQPNLAPNPLPAKQVFRLRRGRLTRLAGRAGGPLLAMPKRPRAGGHFNLTLLPQPKPSQQTASPTKEQK